MIRRYQTKAIISRRSREVCSARKIYICRRNDGSQHTVISAFALSDPTEEITDKGDFRNAGMCYVSENNIYITEEYYGKSETENIQVSIRARLLMIREL